MYAKRCFAVRENLTRCSQSVGTERTSTHNHRASGFDVSYKIQMVQTLTSANKQQRTWVLSGLLAVPSTLDSCDLVLRSTSTYGFMNKRDAKFWASDNSYKSRRNVIPPSKIDRVVYISTNQRYLWQLQQEVIPGRTCGHNIFPMGWCMLTYNKCRLELSAWRVW